MSKTTTVLTGLVRFSYAHVFTPYAMREDQPKKYSVCLIIPKSDTVTVNKIKTAIAAATDSGVSEKWQGKKPSNLKIPLRDGDEERSEDPTFAGAYFINASSRRRPGVVDNDVNDIIDQSEFYSGCYGRAHLNFYAYSAPGNKGIGAGLNHLQKLKEGDKFEGGVSTAEAFGEPVAAAESIDDFFKL